MNNVWLAVVYVSPAENPSWEHSPIYGAEILVSEERAEDAIARIVDEFKRFGRNAEVWSISKSHKTLTVEDIEYLASRFKPTF